MSRSSAEARIVKTWKQPDYRPNPSARVLLSVAGMFEILRSCDRGNVANTIYRKGRIGYPQPLAEVRSTDCGADALACRSRLGIRHTGEAHSGSDSVKPGEAQPSIPVPGADTRS